MTDEFSDIFGETPTQEAIKDTVVVEPEREPKRAPDFHDTNISAAGAVSTPPSADPSVLTKRGVHTKKEPKYIIFIDEVEGQPNYEMVGVNGHMYQIKRGEEVAVPAEVVAVLRNALAARVVQSHAPDGSVQTKLQHYSAIPYRILRTL
jgi:hypothetical protein